MSGQRPYNGLMTNTETLPRIGNFALVACADGTYQVANLKGVTR